MNKAVPDLAKKIAAQIRAAGFQGSMIIHDGEKTHTELTMADSPYVEGGGGS